MLHPIGGPPTLRHPWRVYAGDDNTLTVTITDTDGQPVDLSAATVTAAWRALDTTPAQVPLTVDTTRAADGVLTITATADDTAVEAGTIRSGLFDIQAVQNGTTTTILRGPVTWEADITR
jgi:hypothetical protein